MQKAMLWRTSYMSREPYNLPWLLTPCDYHHYFTGDKRWQFRDGEARPRSPCHDVAEMELGCWLAETKSCAPVWPHYCHFQRGQPPSSPFAHMWEHNNLLSWPFCAEYLCKLLTGVYVPDAVHWVFKATVPSATHRGCHLLKVIWAIIRVSS